MDVLLGRRGEVDAVGAVDLPGDDPDLLLDGEAHIVEWLEVRFPGREDGEDLLGHRFAPLPPFGPDIRERPRGPPARHGVEDGLDLLVSVAGETVERHDRRYAELGDVGDVGLEVHHPPLQRRHVGGAEGVLLDAAVHLERTHRGYDDHGLGLEAPEAALDVEELFGAEVGAESRLGADDVGEPEGQLGGDEGVAAVGDVAEGTAVDDGRAPLEGLHQVREHRVAEEEGHRPRRLDLLGGDRLLVAGEPDHDPAEAGLEVGQVAREAEDRHDLGARHDHPLLLAHRPGVDAAQRQDRVPEGAVVHVDGAGPGDAPGVQLQGVAPMQMVVDHRAEEVVRAGDGVEVAGEVEVDLVHRDHLGIAATGGAPLHPEDRPE